MHRIVMAAGDEYDAETVDLYELHLHLGEPSNCDVQRSAVVTLDGKPLEQFGAQTEFLGEPAPAGEPDAGGVQDASATVAQPDQAPVAQAPQDEGMA